ncbi:MAG: ferric reductase-like transmembrane domain-containing protein [Acidobacteria bacterium Pan2503]|uniref:Ferric reductase-like transmembrane domain-containing protein n=1 Tax=Candidatus Acidiferrum panamense TaxID=2741543 RepID=A0A7V8SZ98_9BACT|nr:ferric reductase-like transmembrane domain-containing protein [Candidatus Acidoferrum panamensis]
MGLTVLDFSAYVGLLAVGAVTLNLLLGMLMAFRYSPHRSWPHRRFNYFRLHNWSGYMALSVSFLHPAVLLLNKDPRFRLLDLLCPVRSPSQPLENTIGAVALYLLAFVVVTSYLRLRLGRRLWKSFHFSIYFAAAALFFHSLWTTPGLKNDPIDWLDGGKLFVESCFLLIASIGLLRWRPPLSKEASEKADRLLRPG